MSRNNFFFLLFLLCACNSVSNEPGIAEKATEASVPINPKTVADIEPQLAKADSVQILYYDNPDGDSLRYTRFFKLAETTDSAQINALLKELNQATMQEPKARPCRSEGKLYLLNGEEVLKTVYFSTRGDNCRYFYFIRDGVFFYLPMTETAAGWLKENRKRAKKPR